MSGILFVLYFVFNNNNLVSVEKAGGKCLPVQCDLRDEDSVKSAFDQAVSKFGGIDILVNNASAISMTGLLFE